MKKTFVILANEDLYDHSLWIKACQDFSDRVKYHIVDLTSSRWMDNISSINNIDYLLAKPSNKITNFRNLYQDRLEILSDSLKYNIFPSVNEIRLYENKKYLAYWLQANKIDHPPTYIYYKEKEALRETENLEIPIVAKTNIGASGRGVQILKNRLAVKDYIKNAFSKGISSKSGPKLDKMLFYRFLKKFKNPKDAINRIKMYKAISSDMQLGYVIFQEYIPHDYEWRIVRIGDSFFAHKKVKVKDKASGGLIKIYDQPSSRLLDFMKVLTDKFDFYSVAVDVFEYQDKYLVNEIQCIFGQSDPYQMLVENKQGRYLHKNNSWEFEEGDFNKNESYNLRLAYLLNL